MHREGPFGRLARWILHHRPIVLAGWAVCTLVGLLASSRLDVDSNLLALLPEREPSAKALRKLHDEEGGANLVTLTFEATTEDPAAFDAYLDELVVDLQRVEGVRFALHEIDPDLAFRLAMLQLDPTEVEQLTLRVRGALALGSSLNPLVTQRIMAMGPLADKIGSAGRSDLLGGVQEGRGRVIVRPTGSSTDPIFSERMVADVERAVEASDPEAHGARLVWMGGAYRHAVEDRKGIFADIRRTSAASALLVLLSVAIAFRTVKATVLLYVPLITSTIMSLGLVWLLFGTVNTYTSFGAAVLLGLGIDYGTHLVARYREKRAKGFDLEEAVVRAWDKTGPPATTSCITSIAGFLALATARFEGFSQLGILLAAGLLLALLVALVVTPALVPTLDAAPTLLLGASHKTSSRKTTYRLAPGLLMVAMLLTGLAATRLAELEWEYDISALRRDGLAYDELSIDEQALARESYSPVVFTYGSRDEVRREHRRIQALIDEGRLEHIARVVSIESVLPADQDARTYAIAQLAALVDHPNFRYLPPPIDANLDRLRGFESRELTRDDLPPELLALLGAAESDQHRVMLFPKGNMWDLRTAGEMSDQVARAVPGKVGAGEFVAMGALYRVVVADMPKVAGLALLLVALLVLIDMRRIHWFVAAYGTLLAGLAWSGVVVEALGVKMSILNIVGLPILVGIGVDVCVHLLHRLREEGPGNIGIALRTTGIAAIVSTQTTLVSFATLLLAGNRGIRSLGLLVAVGLATVFVASVILLPLAWAAGWRVTGRDPMDHRPRRRRRLFRRRDDGDPPTPPPDLSLPG